MIAFNILIGSSLLSSILRNTQLGESCIEELIHENDVPQNKIWGLICNSGKLWLFSELF